MQRMKRLLLLAAAITGTTMLAAAPIAAAHGDSSGNGSASAGTATVSDDQGTVTGTATEIEHDAGSHFVAPDAKVISSRIQQFKQEAVQELQTKRKDEKSGRSTKARQKACVARQKGINTRVTNYAASAQKHLGVFTDILTKVENFYTSKHLNVADYDTLVATAQSKQAAAQLAVDALKGLDVQIDCTQADPAQSVAAVKAAVANARTALQAYRSAIKDVIVALKGVSTSDDSTAPQTTTPTTTTTESVTGGNQ